MEIFNNFDKLMTAMPKLAAEIDDYSANTDNTGWKSEPIYVYKDLTAFAKYELTEGWYIAYNLNLDGDYDGAPNPLDFIDWESFGQALSEEWDDRLHFLSLSGYVVETSDSLY